MNEPIFIGSNKSKLRFQTAVYTIIAVVAFILLFGYAERQEWVPPIVFQGLGVVLGGLCVLAAAAKAKRIKDPNAGLLIDKQGIHDLSSDIGLGLIKWKDITEYKVEQSKKTGLILIGVKKNEVFLRNAQNPAIARLLKQNIRLYDTPVAIDPSYLDASIQEVFERIDEFKSN